MGPWVQATREISRTTRVACNMSCMVLLNCLMKLMFPPVALLFSCWTFCQAKVVKRCTELRQGAFSNVTSFTLVLIIIIAAVDCIQNTAGHKRQSQHGVFVPFIVLATQNPSSCSKDHDSTHIGHSSVTVL